MTLTTRCVCEKKCSSSNKVEQGNFKNLGVIIIKLSMNAKYSSFYGSKCIYIYIWPRLKFYFYRVTDRQRESQSHKQTDRNLDALEFHFRGHKTVFWCIPNFKLINISRNTKTKKSQKTATNYSVNDITGTCLYNCLTRQYYIRK